MKSCSHCGAPGGSVRWQTSVCPNAYNKCLESTARRSSGHCKSLPATAAEHGRHIAQQHILDSPLAACGSHCSQCSLCVVERAGDGQNRRSPWLSVVGCCGFARSHAPMLTCRLASFMYVRAYTCRNASLHISVCPDTSRDRKCKRYKIIRSASLRLALTVCISLRSEPPSPEAWLASVPQEAWASAAIMS